MNTNLPDIRIADKDMEFIFCEIKARLYKNKILKHLSKFDNAEIREIADYLKHNSICLFPYNYKNNYNIKDICVGRDSNNNLLYVKYKGANIYMRKGYKSKYRAVRYFNNILIEQDKNSPHCYISNTFMPSENSVILDIGGAEGYFSMQYVNNVKKIYIFECNEEWIEALNETYKEYKDKVCIIGKFVSDYTDDTHIKLDDFIDEYDLWKDELFIKIDAEGSEAAILGGGMRTLNASKSIKIAVCTYHCQSHERDFRELFKGWKIESSKGYMLYYYDYNFREPYIRRGLLRVERDISNGKYE